MHDEDISLPPFGNLPNKRDPSEQHDAKEKKKQQEEARRSILVQIMTNEARERLARIHLVKSEKASSIEDHIIMMARKGIFKEKVTEPMLIQLLGEMSHVETEKKPKIIVSRRKDKDELNLDDYEL